jgi:hypothetical protein
MLRPYSRITDSPEKVATEKHSSLFWITVSDEEKMFYNIDTWSHLNLKLGLDLDLGVNSLKRYFFFTDVDAK